jgi:hypothetical protein
MQMQKIMVVYFRIPVGKTICLWSEAGCDARSPSHGAGPAARVYWEKLADEENAINPDDGMA